MRAKHVPVGFVRRLTILLAVLAVYAIVAGPASAAKSVPIEDHNASCGFTTGAPVIGQATFSRSGNTLTVTYALTSGAASSSYDIDLYDGATCDDLGFFGTLTTNGSGAGSFTFTANVAGRSQFFVTGFNPGATTR